MPSFHVQSIACNELQFVCNNSRLLKRDGKYSRLQHFRIELNIFHHVGKPDIIAQKLQCKHATIAHNIADTLTDTQP